MAQKLSFLALIHSPVEAPFPVGLPLLPQNSPIYHCISSTGKILSSSKKDFLLVSILHL